ncbi:MAG: hypothetical protein RI924_1261 [Bacteroidota bacterium]|jgi:hypothetical protein
MRMSVLRIRVSDLNVRVYGPCMLITELPMRTSVLRMRILDLYVRTSALHLLLCEQCVRIPEYRGLTTAFGLVFKGNQVIHQIGFTGYF